MHLLRLAITFLALAAGCPILTAEDSPRRPIGPPFGEPRYATIYEGYELRRIVPEGMTWDQFAQLAPSPEALRRVLFQRVSEVESLSGEDNLLKDLGVGLSARVTAGSWTELLARTNPAFTWHDGDLLWIEPDSHGRPQFTLDEAYLFQPPGEKPRWVLLDPITGAPFDEVYRDSVMGRNLRAVATLKSKRPEPRDGGFLEEDGQGIDAYAIELGRHPAAGTVCEIGWQKLMGAGVAHPVELRKVYLLRDREGRWQFLGEGLGNYYDRENESEAVARLEWVEGTPAPRPAIRFMREDDDHGHFSGEDDRPKDWRDVVTCEDYVLDAPFPAEARPTFAHPYLVAQTGDTFEGIVEHLVRHQYGWPDGADGRELCRAVLRRLNPGFAGGAFAAGTKIFTLSYGDLVHEVQRHERRR